MKDKREKFTMQLDNRSRYGSFKSKNILIVDDEKDLGCVLQDMMQEAGHRIIFASTFKEGLDKFRKASDLDTAIVDLRLKDRSGLTFVKEAKAMRDKVNFIMISAFATDELKDEARLRGISHFLDKPLKIEKLLEVVSCEAI